MTFYIWPLGCSLFVESVPARVGVDGRLQSVNPTSNVTTSLTPFIRPRPTNPMEQLYWNITDGLFNVQATDLSMANRGGGNIKFTWLELLLLGAVVNGTGIDAMENYLSHLSTLTYSLIVQNWRSALLTGDASYEGLWVPVYYTVSGTRPLLTARLKVNGVPLITGCICVLLLVIACLATIRRFQAHDSVIRDGGVIDIISLLHRSSLPGIIVGDPNELHDRRRERAERTMIRCVIVQGRNSHCF